jgi:hypothetical protein
MIKSKKGNILVLLIVIIALVVIVAQIFQVAGRECTENSNCNDENYCGSDFQCHPYPSITKYNLVPAAAVIALGLVAAAYILRRRLEDVL